MEDQLRIIEDLFTKYTSAFGKDQERYHNHVCRVFLNCTVQDSDQNNWEKYAFASFFHDIGIWTAKTIDYLDPSIAEMKQYAGNTGKSSWIDEIALMIDMHHKIRKYKGSYEQTVETFRRADWIDVTVAVKAFSVKRKLIRANRKKYPNKGFHLFLVRKIFGSFFRHPFRNPLPMFKS
jgi:hypothetical protein